MNAVQLRRWLKSQIRWLQYHIDDYDEAICADSAAILRSAKRKAMRAGLPDVAGMLACSVELLAPSAAEQYLSAALAAMPDTRLSSVPQVARRYGVSPAKVRSWIASGQLRATNTGKQRARYRVTPEALAEFDARGVVKIERRRKLDVTVRRY